MAEILWISRKKEIEQNGRLCLPPRRRNVSREDVEAAVESVWQEVCMGLEAADPASGEVTGELIAPPVPQLPEESGQAGEAGGTAEIPAGETGESETPGDSSEELPPCPWEIRYYPDLEAAELVEVLLKS